MHRRIGLFCSGVASTIIIQQAISRFGPNNAKASQLNTKSTNLLSPPVHNSISQEEEKRPPSTFASVNFIADAVGCTLERI